MANTSSLVTIAPRREPPVLVCKKCLKRADGGRDIKRALKSELKSRPTSSRVKPPRIVMTSCFGICPKHAVVVASAATLARGDYLLLADEASVAEAVAQLMPISTRAPTR